MFNLARRHGVRGTALEVECVGQVEAEYGDAVEHRQPEQSHARARREHVWIFASEEPNNS